MKLSEAIKDISDDDWIEITEQATDKYKSPIGRAPKKLITGEVLDYGVLYINDTQYKPDYTLHRFLVRDNFRNAK